MTQTLEAIFADLCAKHELTSLSVSFSATVSPSYTWGSYAHWGSNTVCASGHGATPQEAIAAAILSAAEKRAHPPVDVPAITMEMAALSQEIKHD